MDIEADDTLLQISKGIRGTNGGIALMAGIQRQHGESLETIIRLVTPEPGSASDGLSLEELIGALLVRLDHQSAYLKDITVELAKITQDMPLDVVRAIAKCMAVPSLTCCGTASYMHPDHSDSIWAPPCNLTAQRTRMSPGLALTYIVGEPCTPAQLQRREPHVRR